MGQASKRNRDCPAVGRAITSAECGATRNTLHPCPPECRFNPFSPSNYERFLEIENQTISAMLDFQFAQTGGPDAILVPDTVVLRENGGGINVAASVLPTLHYAFALGRNSQGNSLTQLWEEREPSALNNDQRAVLRHICQARPTLLEVQRPINDIDTECLDLLDPERGPLVLRDRSIQVQVGRFTRFWTWLVPYRDFCRPSGTPETLPDEDTENTLAAIQSEASKAGIPPKEHLAANFGQILAGARERAVNRIRRMLRKTDLHDATTVYRLRAPAAEIQEILDSKPDFDRNPQPGGEDGAPRDVIATYEWVRRGESKAIEKRMPAAFRHDDDSPYPGGLARVHLSQSQLRVHTTTRQKLEFSKKLVKRFFGRRVELESEMVRDTAREFAEAWDGTSGPGGSPPPAAPEALPPEAADAIRRSMANIYHSFPDTPVPMLGNVTPRQAASRPGMRPLLVELMKGHVRSVEVQTRNFGIDFDLDWLLGDLGLHELRADPSRPVRRPSKPDHETGQK